MITDPRTLNENARHLIFLAAAWIANVDGQERESQLDALCQLRGALEISPDLARQLRDMARNSILTSEPL